MNVCQTSSDSALISTSVFNLMVRYILRSLPWFIIINSRELPCKYEKVYGLLIRVRLWKYAHKHYYTSKIHAYVHATLYLNFKGTIHVCISKEMKLGDSRPAKPRICTHVIVVHECVYMERQRSETPYRHANFLRRTLAWPPMMMTRTETMVVVVNANDVMVVVVVVVITIVRHLQRTVPFLCSWWTEHSCFLVIVES